jgi:membrane protease YdiL (CAAX protease family)
MGLSSRLARAFARGQPGSPRPGREAAFAAAACGVLAVYNNLDGPWQRTWYPVANLAATGAAVAAARASGLSAADLGLRPDRLKAGVRSAAGPAAALAAGWLVLAATPATRPALADQRISGLTWPGLGYQVIIRIPLGTVLWEETAFRGVLQAALRRILPGPAAIAVSSTVFGIWHVRPTVAALRINQMAASHEAELGGAAAAVAGTAAAGVLLSWLRERSGSLAAPVLLHLTANCGGALAAWWVVSRR